MKPRGILLFFCGAILLLLSACTITQNGVPDDCSIPEGVEVVSLTLDESQAGELPATGEARFSVNVELNRALTDQEIATVCFAVRESQIGGAKPLTMGLIILTAGSMTSDRTATRDNVFMLICKNGNIAGRALAIRSDMSARDRNSGERSTKIFVQHLEGIRTFAGIEIGIKGVKSNKIRVSCPR